jgi:rubrerythrin
MKGQQVGHIKKEAAAKLAPLLDQMKNMTTDATIPNQGTSVSMPVTISLLTTSSRPLSNFELEPIYSTIIGSLSHYFHKAKKPPKLSHVTPSPTEMNRAPLQALTTGLANIASASGEDQKPKAHEDTSSPDRDRGPSLKALTAGLTEKDAELEVEMTNVDWADAHEELDQMFDQQTKNRLEQLPDYAMPPQLQNLELFDYQKDGIRWLIHQERNESAISPFVKEIFQNGTKKWICTITRCIFTSPPKGICGGVLADGT